MEEKIFDLIILGGGPAGLNAALYAKRGGIDVAIIDTSSVGGQPVNYLEIENYLGTGTTNKTIGFKKVISFLNDIDMYNEFKNSEDFKELKFIIHNINSKIKKL